jgi:NTP pyrophosphatase (non-canonical NTP hydrolase)
MTVKNETTLADIRQAVREFRDARNWRQFHSPKNLSMSIAIEAAELMEHFQWLTTGQATALIKDDPETKTAITEELADVLIYCFSLADMIECDIAEIILDKLAKNDEKYPVEAYQGRF